MAKLEHVTIEGETVSDIAELYYGDVSPYLTVIYDLNPKLAIYGKILPAGLKVFVDLSVVEDRVIDRRRELWEVDES